jgi:hypothetical protein
MLDMSINRHRGVSHSKRNKQNCSEKLSDSLFHLIAEDIAVRLSLNLFLIPSTEDIKVATSKPDTKDDLNVATSESESEEDDELTNAGKDIKKMLQKDQGDVGSSEEEDEDPEGDEVKGPSALFLQGTVNSIELAIVG